jgi:hypothetical protein
MVGLKMEVHYNNPSMTSGNINRSGARLTFTTNLREFDAAPMILGDPLLGLRNVPIGEGWSEWDFNCPSSCTKNYLDQEITVFTNWLHMHESGERMVFKQYNTEGERCKRSMRITSTISIKREDIWFPRSPSRSIQEIRLT